MQFETFMRTNKQRVEPHAAGTEECTDFFHFMYSQGKKTRTIDQAKSALIAYLNAKGLKPNPAQDASTRRYIVGLQKYNNQNNIDEKKKAHTLTVIELSTLLNALSSSHPFVGTMCVWLDWCRALKQTTLRNLIREVVEMTPDLPIGISLHSLSRGGSFYRVFESRERRFNFRELMTWCRWANAKTCSEYLVTQSISNEFDPRNLLRSGTVNGQLQWQGGVISGVPCAVDELTQKLAKSVQAFASAAVPAPKVTKQLSMDNFVAQKPYPLHDRLVRRGSNGLWRTPETV
ncbi:hypothetical protein DYB31_006706 [Aphanomyces astaci]|uniref:Core-binding (CB) domain-containing protein n=1 Tax=Aphanomyces astaci TaxID=112090 RepID=A0A397F616_APHAT|nr:hypothetical protein DYB31_006706 [Aphanomyces astaci]